MAGTLRHVNALPIHVAVLSPQAVVVEGLRAILATNDDVKFVDLNGDETTPDVVLYDAMCLLGVTRPNWTAWCTRQVPLCSSSPVTCGRA